MNKKAKEGVGGAQRPGKRLPCRVFLQFVAIPGRPLRHVEATRRTAPYKEHYEQISRRLFSVWDECQNLTPSEGRATAGLLSVEIEFAQTPRTWPAAAGTLLLDELTTRVKPLFLGSQEEPQPVALAAARAAVEFQPLPVLELLEGVTGTESVAENHGRINTGIPIVDEPQRQGGPLPSPGSTEEPQKAQAALRALIDQAFSEPPPGSGPRLATFLSRIDQFRGVARQHVQAALREFVYSQAAADYEAKQQIVAVVNAAVDRLGLAIRYEDQACYLAATVGVEYPRGRFLIVPKGSKKPLLTRTHLLDLPALDLMDVVQQEAVPPPSRGPETGASWGEREEARHSGRPPSQR